MLNDTLSELLKTFTQNELKIFSEFLKSSYFNKRKAVLKLFMIISKYHPEYQSKQLSKNLIFKKLFPGKKFNDSTIRVLFHYLTELTQKFLAIQRFESNLPEYFLQLQSVYRDRNQIKLFNKNYFRAMKSLESVNITEEEYRFFKFKFEDENTYFRFSSKYANYDKVIRESDWEKTYYELTGFYLIKSMIMYLNTLNMKSLYSREFASESFEKMFSEINIADYENFPAVKMYYYLIKMKKDEKHELYYYQLQQLLKAHKSEIKKYDLTGAYVNMEIYCVKRISEGFEEFEKERFKIFKMEISEKTYQLNDGSMSPLFYRNTVMSALTVNEIKWVKNFINNYKEELNVKFRKNYFNYCSALYYFHLSEHQQSINLLSEVNFEDIYMKLDCRILYLQNLYELQMEDTLHDSLENFRHFIKKIDIISNESKMKYNNFCKYFKKINLIKNRHSKNENELLLKEVLNENNLMNKSWLVNKIKYSV